MPSISVALTCNQWSAVLSIRNDLTAFGKAPSIVAVHVCPTFVIWDDSVWCTDLQFSIEDKFTGQKYPKSAIYDEKWPNLILSRLNRLGKYRFLRKLATFSDWILRYWKFQFEILLLKWIFTLVHRFSFTVKLKQFTIEVESKASMN